MARILVCDDDADTRAAMRRMLRAHAVVEVASPREALDVLKASTFDAIICDFAMGDELDGLEVLQIVKVMYPEVTRFLVTGDRAIEIAIRALNEHACDRYFLKPWNDQGLRSALEIALHARGNS